MTDFTLIEGNLRHYFRSLAEARAHAVIREFSGIAAISLGVRFQMFNAAFLANPVEDERDFERRVTAASVHFHAHGQEWSLWLCDGLLSEALQRRATRILQRTGLRQSSLMPGMLADALNSQARNLPECEIREVDSPEDLESFRQVGATCFHVPRPWFDEVFDEQTIRRGTFRSWLALADGRPVCTAATVLDSSAIGIYNVGTIPEFRGRGYAEAIVRECIRQECIHAPPLPIVLQSTQAGLNLYHELGFRSLTRFRVWVA